CAARQGADRGCRNRKHPNAGRRTARAGGGHVNKAEPASVALAEGLPAPAPAAEALAVVRKALAHDSAVKHVMGSAAYIDDLPAPAGTLHLAPGYAPIAA